MESRMGILRRLAVAVLVLLLVTSSVWAGGFDVTGLGSKARAMGGAFRAIADDWTAAYYNPAGHAFVYDNLVGGTVGFLHYRHELIPDYRYGGVYESGIINDQSLYNKHEILSNPAAGIILQTPYWGGMAVGFSMYQPFDNNIEWTLYEMPLAYNDSLFNDLPLDHYYSNLDVVAFQLTFARRFSEDRMAVGLGLQLLRADLAFNDIIFRANPADAPLSDRPRDRIVQFSQNDGYGWGFGLTAGLLYQVNEKLRVALTGSLPFDITVDGSTYQMYYMPLDGTLNSRTLGSVDNIWVNGNLIAMQPDFEATIKLPASVGFGVSYDVTPKLTVAVDASYTLWSKYEGLEFVYSNWDTKGLAADPTVVDFFESDVTLADDWNNVGKVAAGVSYEYADYLTLLGGVSADQSADRDPSGFRPQLVDTGDKWGLNLGAIFTIQQWELGIASSYIHAPDIDINSLQDVNDDGVFDNFPGEYKAETFETILSFNYRF